MVNDLRLSSNAGGISDIPLIMGEWNNVGRVKVEETDHEVGKTEA